MNHVVTKARIQRDLVGPDCTLIETHISWVVLGPQRVIKIKKPVDFGFLDFTTMQARKSACEAEVALNRRLTSDVYDGVVALVARDGELAIEPASTSATPVDWAVQMRRLHDRDRADIRLARGELDRTDIASVAERLASFHRQAARGPAIAAQAQPEQVEGNVRENFTQTRELVTEHIRPGEAAEIEERQLAFLRDHAAWFRARCEGGHIVEGHGDLRLEHIYLEGPEQLQVIDCIEFNDRFRCGDVIADLAFLHMDLLHHGRADLAEHLVSTYVQTTGDYDAYRGLDFYTGYRAYVRAKIDSMVAADPKTEAHRRAVADERARRYYLQALSAERPALLGPRVVAVGGLIASGKSTVAAALAERLGAPRVSSDVTRKQLCGVEATASLQSDAFDGAYTEAMTERVYAAMIERARAVLASGRPVVLDASFRTAEARAKVRAMAQEVDVPFVFVECSAPAEVCKARLREREGQATESDGRLALFEDFVARYEPPDELDAGQRIRIDTAGPLQRSLAPLEDRLPAWPPGLTD